MLTLLTPTGCRPQAWALCQRWAFHQTYKGPVHWVIVDDGEYRQDVTFRRDGWHLDVVRPKHRWTPGMNTQGANFCAGLELIGDDAWVLPFEDDDFYAPGWLERAAKELETADLIGQGWNKYYHVRTGAIRENDNDTHASLCASAFKGEALKLFRRQAKRAPTLIDVPMWKHANNKRVFKDMLVIGMKGMPGRGGIAGGHKMTTDTPFDLSQWIGDDAAAYSQFR